ncbi:MAG: hypothetical protein M1820_005618 [Bogoriella megaspora]|nr:MAG: hypothetical protein M1820_005618 [Bogoriella megaspora]
MPCIKEPPSTTKEAQRRTYFVQVPYLRESNLSEAESADTSRGLEEDTLRKAEVFVQSVRSKDRFA